MHHVDIQLQHATQMER